MTITVRFWSWFKDLAGTDTESYSVPDSATLGDLLERIRERHPRFAEVRQSTLVAVGVEYQPPSHPLRAGDEVSLFPPVQGG